MNEPKRGEIWLALVGGARLRPCLILSDPAEDEEGTLATVIPATSRPRGLRSEFTITGIKGLPGKSYFDVRSLTTLSVLHLKQRVGTLDRESMAQVEAEVRTWLGL